MANYGENIFTSTLKILGVKYTKKYSNSYFNEHPNKYNLLGISTMLHEYGIKNAGIKIENNKTNLYEIELPFIAHIGNDFILVYKIDNEKVYFFWQGKKLSSNIDVFLQSWSGVVLLLEFNNNAKEPNYKNNFKEEIINYSIKTVLFIFSFLFIGVGFIKNKIYDDIGILSLLTFNLLGTYISYLLVLKQLHYSSKYADKICSFFDRKGCNNILETDASKFFGIISWSEIGIGYFSSNFIITIFFPQFIPYLALTILGCLFYSVWSIYYQKIVAKQWCSLCLIIQLIFFIIFINNIVFGLIEIPIFTVTNIVIVGCVYSIPVLLSHLIISKMSELGYLESLKQEINSIKTTEEIFIAFLKMQQYYEVNKSDSKILFGNPNSPNLITILTNPYCNPCSFMHRRVETFLNGTFENVCIQYIFSSFGEDLDSTNKFLIAIYLKYGEEKAKQVYSEWFSSEGKYLGDVFFEKHNIDINNPDVEQEFNKQKTWKEKSLINVTPKIFINGFILPNNYRIEDLSFFYKNKY